MAEKKLPVVEFTLDEGEISEGVKTISLVDQPAMESNYIFFSKEKEIKNPSYVKMGVEGYKNTVFGAVLIPEKYIYRIDQEGNEYYGYFTAETIEKLKNKFHKEQQTSKVNLNHESDNYIDAYLNSSYVIDTEEMLKDAENKGLKDITLGTWVASYKIEEDDVFQDVIDGKYNGFSIEAFLEREMKAKKIKDINKLYTQHLLDEVNKNIDKRFEELLNKLDNKKTSTMKNKLIERLSKLVEEYSKENLETEESTEETVELARAVTVDGDMYEWGEVGQPVFKIITNDETQEETTEAVEEGTYEFEDGSKIVVDAEGNLVEFTPAPEESTEDAPTEEETMSEEVVAEEDGSTADKGKTLEELIDISKDGYYTIEVSVEGGAISYGAIYSSTWKELDLKMEELEKLREEKVKLEKQVEELNETIIGSPINENSKEVKNDKEVDFSKMSNVEKIAYRNNLKL